MLRTLFLCCFLFVSYNVSAQIDFSYVDDHEAMVKQAEVYKKPFIVYFTMDICPPCERMKREVFSDQQVSQIANEKYLTYSVNISHYSGKRLGSEHNVSVAPTFMFFDANGNLQERVEGAVSQTNFRKLLEEHASVEVPHTEFSNFR